MLRLFCTYEAMTRFVFPLLSSVQGKPVTVSVSIIDVTGVGLMQFWRLRTHMQSASVLATAHYPETLGKTFVCVLYSGISAMLWLTRTCFRSSAHLRISQRFGGG